MSSTLLALDRSLRSVDADGHMRVAESRISKACVSPYLGEEIPEWESLGLNPLKTYRLLRDPIELEKGASSFDGKPLLIRHVGVHAKDPQQELIVGTLGKCTFEPPYLITRPLMLWTQEAIDLIESDRQRELSSAYRYRALMQPGIYDGQPYDGRMVDIRGNHTAIVKEGRVGPDVFVADSLPPEFRRMKSTSLSALLAGILAGCLPKEADRRKIALALDGALGETPAESVISLDAEEMRACDEEATAEKRKEEGEDAELTDEEREEAYKRARDKKAKDKKAKDTKRAKDAKRARDRAADEREAALDAREEAMDAREEEDDDDDDDEEAKDRKRARDARRKARDSRRHGRDALADPSDHRRDFRSDAEDSVTKDEMTAAIKAATDGAREGVRKQFRDAAEMREKVRPLVGTVSIAMDSAEDIARFALKQAGVKHDGVHASALGALVDMAVETKTRQSRSQAAPIAMDGTQAQLLDIDAIFSPKRAA